MEISVTWICPNQVTIREVGKYQRILYNENKVSEGRTRLRRYRMPQYFETIFTTFEVWLDHVKDLSKITPRNFVCETLEMFIPSIQISIPL